MLITMKTMRLILALLVLPGLALANLKAAKEIPFIYLSQDQVLYITVIDNVYDEGNVADRFYDIEETLIEVLDLAEFPMAYKIVRFGARVPKDQPEMQLFVHKWGSNGLGEIEVRLNASLKETSLGRSRNKLGYFRYADGGFPMMSQTRTTAKYNEVLRMALIKLIGELNDHFELEFDDSGLGGTSLPSSLGTPVPDQ